jgi:hypothetical protein
VGKQGHKGPHKSYAGGIDKSKDEKRAYVSVSHKDSVTEGRLGRCEKPFIGARWEQDKTEKKTDQ